MALATSDVETVRNMIGSGVVVLTDAILLMLSYPMVMFLISPSSLSLRCAFAAHPWIVWRKEREIHRPMKPFK